MTGKPAGNISMEFLIKKTNSTNFSFKEGIEPFIAD